MNAVLVPIEIPPRMDERPVPLNVLKSLRQIEERIERFQDCWNQDSAEQFVAADYGLVYQHLDWITENQPSIGRRFLEWGCGFATVACLADDLDWASYAIESHIDLVKQARLTMQQCGANIELFEGNFLPSSAEQLAADPMLPSLGHPGESPYEVWDLEIDDFSLIYSYPWPGEDEFHEDVFDRFAANGAMLLMFIGPNEMRLWRKVGGR